MTHLRRMKVRGLNPRVVLDVGAAHGDWTKSCQRIFPDAHFMGCSSRSLTTGAELSALARRGRIEYIPAAIRPEETEDTLPLLVPAEPGGSSFLAASREDDSYFKRSVDGPRLAIVEPRYPFWTDCAEARRSGLRARGNRRSRTPCLTRLR